MQRMPNPKLSLLKKIMDADFVIHEAVLYLDGHPDSKKALDYYNKAVKAKKDLYEQYNAAYGPITAGDVRQNTWSWIDDPWPWQNNKEVNG